ncbi:DUF423 domain-containing protein [Shewanella sp. 202IG2-18]|uniref:DUF423 domain-containing protein n=1 Tax=Parashewanella hymeniacidonis TaxID=2807618 RepID=UPI0019603027|nr:DUF423 domain-containing protein [Parashewanella hymeniacidonis]MBM7074181.1 DUF423 domain-containing protein [Parashewanella hymeniacidonis]
MRKGLFLIACFFGFLATAFGAFGAHGLKSVATKEMIEIFNLGVEYQFYHTFAIMGAAIAGQWLPSKRLDYSAYAFIIGIIFFSGSLYAYALTGTKLVAIMTPIGGMSFLVGWLLLAATVWQNRMESKV